MLLGALAEGFGLLMIVPLASIAIGQDAAALSRFAPWVARSGAGPALRGRARTVRRRRWRARSALLFCARPAQLARLQAGYEASLRLRAASTLARRGWTFASRIGQAGMQSLLLNDVPRAALAIGYRPAFAVAAVMLLVQLTLTALLSPTLTLSRWRSWSPARLLSVRWTRRGVRADRDRASDRKTAPSSGFRLHAGLKAALAQGTVAAFLDEYRREPRRRRGADASRFTRDYSASRQLAAFGGGDRRRAAAVRRRADAGAAVPGADRQPGAVRADESRRRSRSSNRRSTSPPTRQSFAAIERRLGKLEPPSAPSRAASRSNGTMLGSTDARFEHRPGLGLRAAPRWCCERGEWIGIAGASGAGKTTLRRPRRGAAARRRTGAIPVDGEPLDGRVLDRWRAGLAYVGQEGTVFNDSVRGNLLAEGARADERALWAGA